MIPSEVQEIISDLLKKTRKGKVNWLPTADLDLPGGEDDFAVSMPDYSLNIYSQGENIIFAIYNNIGKEVYSFGLNTLAEGYPILEELHKLARIQALSVDEIFESILEHLKKEDVIGKPKPPEIPF